MARIVRARPCCESDSPLRSPAGNLPVYDSNLTVRQVGFPGIRDSFLEGMTDDEFLQAMRIAPFPAETSLNPLTEALRIDDLRSCYCEQLEVRIAEQAAVIRLLQFLLTRAEVPYGPGDP
jgi:hypothetical protein